MPEENLKFPFNPIRRSLEVESAVMRGEKRPYHRFRPAPYYGGIATADAVGCQFLCAYCWNYFRNLNPHRFKNFYTPQQVAAKLLLIARKKGFRLFRISGAEPILGENSLDHLKKVIELILREVPRSIFVLETNGFFLGYKPELIGKLRFPNLNIRVCLKGTDEDSFEKITGAQRKFFSYPFTALKTLEENGIRTWPALMIDLFNPEEIEELKKKLEEMGIKARLELETLEAYPFVTENLKKRRLKIKNQ